ncbi:tetratricopeptide repeat protein [Streptomyces sp. NPDC057486]|uniref:tetratricopeptide repeat protein n=1 Tax=Streptomyces sp. NPDC057486 TaxID=3346145 RepID=UPI00369236B3
MNGRNDAQADGHGRVYQASGDQHIVEHHHHGPEWSGPASVRRPSIGRAPVVLRDRVELLAPLRAAVTAGSGNQVFVLHGLGGCGKTTVAYAVFEHATGEGDQIGLWVNASDTTSLRASMLAVAADRGATDGELAAARSGLRAAADLVWDYLDQSDQPWLLVIDNADDPAVLRDGAWLRASPRGTVLVTTRQAAARWWPGAVLLHVSVLPRDAAAQVLCDLAPGSGTTDEAAAIADRLGRLPLALTLAGTFLAQQVIDPWTMTEYGIHLDGGQTTDPIALIDQGAESISDDSRHLVSRTWKLSLNALTDQGLPEAHALLRLLACWASDPLPVRLLAKDELDPHLPAPRIESALRGLLDHSLTELMPGSPRCLSTHGVLLESVAKSTPRDQRGLLVSTAAQLLMSVLPEVPERGSSAAQFNQLSPHVLALLQRAVSWKDLGRSIVEVATECSLRLMVGLHRAGDYASALALGGEAVILAEGRLGEGHALVLKLRQRIGRTLHRLGRFEEAEALLREVLEDCERVFGLTALDTLETCLALSHPLWMLDRTPESVVLIRRAVAGRTDVLGSVHPLTIIARYHLLGLPPGPELDEEVAGGPALVADCHSEFEPGHGVTLIAEHEYSYALFFTGQPTDALPRARRVFAAYERRHGLDHPITQNARALLSQILAALGEIPEAIEHAEAVAEKRIRVLGPAHPWTVVAQERLAKYRMS